MIRRVVAGAVFVAFVLGTAFGQSSAAPPEFEVASVRLANPDADNASTHLSSLNAEPGRNVNFVNINLRDLILLAYGVGKGQRSGPDWLAGPSGLRFDIIAKIPADASKEQVPQMLQTLLAQRFKLALHRERKDISVYALEVNGGGSKLQESPADDTSPSGCSRSAAQNPEASLAATCHKMTSASLAQAIPLLAPGYFDRPVVDMTGLKGTYNLTIEWITNGQARNGDAGPTMFVAVEKLGLKLQARKQPMEMLIVDHCEKEPTEN